MPLLCLRKLARARARRRLPSAFFSEDRGRPRRGALPILLRRRNPLFTPYRAKSRNFLAWGSYIRLLATTKNRCLSVVGDNGEKEELVVCDACHKRETRKAATLEVRCRQRQCPASMHVQALDQGLFSPVLVPACPHV